MSVLFFKRVLASSRHIVGESCAAWLLGPPSLPPVFLLLSWINTIIFIPSFLHVSSDYRRHNTTLSLSLSLSRPCEIYRLWREPQLSWSNKMDGGTRRK